MLIAIDHGNKQVKTVHGNAIVSGVQKSKTRPYGRDVLKYGGSYYTLSAQRIPYQKDKTTDERFFILSLFAIAEEIEAHPDPRCAVLSAGVCSGGHDVGRAGNRAARADSGRGRLYSGLSDAEERPRRPVYL